MGDFEEWLWGQERRKTPTLPSVQCGRCGELINIHRKHLYQLGEQDPTKDRAARYCPTENCGALVEIPHRSLLNSWEAMRNE